MKATTELIRFAYQSPYGWGVVGEYLQEDIAKDEKEAKKWADPEKSIEAKMRQKRMLDDREYNDRSPTHMSNATSATSVCSLTAATNVFQDFWT